MKRRSFLKTSSIAAIGAGGLKTGQSEQKAAPVPSSITLSLNAYSFNQPLMDGEMSIEALFQFAKETGFAGVDLTAYYIPGYPEVPDDDILFRIKRDAFKTGIAISGTGVRNDFTLNDAARHEENLELVRQWVIAASKLGAPHVRIFAGHGDENSSPREIVKGQVISAFRQCADFAEGYGVMVVFQNHQDFISSTEETLEIVKAVQSEWFGLMLDTGSVTGTDPYSGIARLIPYAVTWQVKENIRSGNGFNPTDFSRLMKIVKDHGYRGYFPLETLGEGDPRKKVRKLFKEVSQYPGSS